MIDPLPLFWLLLDCMHMPLPATLRSLAGHVLSSFYLSGACGAGVARESARAAAAEGSAARLFLPARVYAGAASLAAREGAPRGDGRGRRIVSDPPPSPCGARAPPPHGARRWAEGLVPPPGKGMAPPPQGSVRDRAPRGSKAALKRGVLGACATRRVWKGRQGAASGGGGGSPLCGGGRDGRLPSCGLCARCVPLWGAARRSRRDVLRTHDARVARCMLRSGARALLPACRG